VNTPLPRVARLALIVIAALVAGSVGSPTRATTGPRPFPIDLDRATMAQLQQALTDRVISSERLVEAYVERIRAVNTRGPALNAIRLLAPDAVAQARRADHERRRNRVRGPLHGIPILIKDNIDVAGLPTTAGALALADSRPSRDAFVVARLRAAGAIILGKTNLTEFANFATAGLPPGYSALGGQVLNPYDASQSPSGSSSGSGAAVAAGLAAITVGTETNGSITGPAVAHSLVGVKPTVGLTSRSGVIPIATTQDVPGPIARTVYDAAVLLNVLTSADAEDPVTGTAPSGVDYTAALSTTALRGRRIGVASAPTGNPGALFAAAQEALRAEGATVLPVTVETTGLPPGILTYEFKRDFNAYLARLPEQAPMDTLDDVVRFNLAHAAEGATKFGQTQLVLSNNVDLDDPATRATYEADRAAGIAIARERIDSALAANDLDAILFFGIGSAAIGARAQYPSVALPIGYDPANNRPVGVTLLGTAFSEADLLAMAYDYERVAPPWRPPSEVNPSLFDNTNP
jgi:amidase